MSTSCPATSLFKLLLKYRPEDKAAKKERLLNKAKAESEGKTLESKKPVVVKYGINHITYLIEQVWAIAIILLWVYIYEILMRDNLCRLHSRTDLRALRDDSNKILLFKWFRARLSSLLLLMTSTQLNWLCGCLHFAARWVCPTVSWRASRAWDRYVVSVFSSDYNHRYLMVGSDWGQWGPSNILWSFNSVSEDVWFSLLCYRLFMPRLLRLSAWHRWKTRTSMSSRRSLRLSRYYFAVSCYFVMSFSLWYAPWGANY